MATSLVSSTIAHHDAVGIPAQLACTDVVFCRCRVNLSLYGQNAAKSILSFPVHLHLALCSGDSCQSSPPELACAAVEVHDLPLSVT
jgi:hypothetical protein